MAVGCAVTEAGSARYNRTGDWRSSRPVWEHAHCVRCGVCQMFCPEGCIQFEPPKDFPAADLEYCKGCGICVHECPTACIRMVAEEE
ncbi:MAG: 4Fe-4S binding protein [Myxococcales bacterium]|nr:4Fe-4S binding protein [Myxococcales bacterium]